MTSFEVVNVTLWNLVLAINKAHKDSCSMQVVRDYNNNGSIFSDSSRDMMIQHSIPIIFVDNQANTKDLPLHKVVKVGKYLPFSFRCSMS